MLSIQALKYVQDRAQACAHEEPYCPQQALLKALWQVLAALLKHPPGGNGGGGGALRLLGWGQVREGRGMKVQNFSGERCTTKACATSMCFCFGSVTQHLEACQLTH